MCNYLVSTVSLSRAQPQCQATVHPQEACRLEAQAAGAKSQGFLKPHAHLRVGPDARAAPAGLRAGIWLPHGTQIPFAGISLCHGYPPSLWALIFKRKHGVPHRQVSPSAELVKVSRQKTFSAGLLRAMEESSGTIHRKLTLSASTQASRGSSWDQLLYLQKTRPWDSAHCTCQLRSWASVVYFSQELAPLAVPMCFQELPWPSRAVPLHQPGLGLSSVLTTSWRCPLGPST